MATIANPFAGNANTGQANTWTARQIFNAANVNASIQTNDIYVEPNTSRSTSASVLLDNTAGQVWEFFNNSGGAFGVYDDTHSQQPISIGSNITNQLNMFAFFTYVVNAHLAVNTAGFGLYVKEGSNAKQGTAVLNGTTAVVVSNTSVTANSRIFLTVNSPSGTVGSPYVSAISANTSFSIKSTSASDASTVAYEIFESN